MSSRSITVVMTEDQAVDVAEAVSMRKGKLQDMDRRGVDIDTSKVERLSVVGRLIDVALRADGD